MFSRAAAAAAGVVWPEKLGGWLLPEMVSREGLGLGKIVGFNEISSDFSSSAKTKYAFADWGLCEDCLP